MDNSLHKLSLPMVVGAVGLAANDWHAIGTQQQQTTPLQPLLSLLIAHYSALLRVLKCFDPRPQHQSESFNKAKHASMWQLFSAEVLSKDQLSQSKWHTREESSSTSESNLNSKTKSVTPVVTDSRSSTTESKQCRGSSSC